MNQQHQQPPQYPPPVYIVQQQAPPSTTLPTIVNLFLPPLGQLIQGRIVAFLLWLGMMFCTGLAIGLIAFLTGGFGLLLGFVAGPILYILCILDSAWYKG
jgi:hypothetical protein